ncbi:MAG: hypothetical protein ACT6RP_14135 [Roseateles sp.]|uniref:hypothetical protein n=2 Tax=Roseateles sp. TaxID=1971397 RepID=UPI004035C80A
MKSGFKPKLWTKKEWTDADPSSKTQGCGVEAALDEWQKHCKGKFAAMTPEEAAKASMTATKLSEAMTKASKKCDPKAQKETLMGILEYKKRADDYAQFAKLAAAALIGREKYAGGIKNFDTVMKDAAAETVFERYCKQPQVAIWPSVDTLRLFAQKKYADAVRLYGDGGVGGGDYNIRGVDNKILHDTFIAKVRHEQKDILEAISKCVASQKEMLSDPRHYGDHGLKAMPEWKALVEKKFPIKEYAVN